MKAFKILTPLLLLCVFGLQSCIKDKCTTEHTYIKYTPVYRIVDEIRKDIQIEAPRELERPGKMYFYQNYILLNEYREGVHIIDNQDSKNPQIIAFIKIPGNMDMAVKNNVLYADNYIDLLSIDISDPANPALRTRTEDVFPYFDLDQDLGYLVYYDEQQVTENIPCTNSSDKDGSGPSNPTSSVGGSGQFSSMGMGGSMARFTLKDDFLYTVSNSDLNSFDISDAINPSLSNTINLDWGIETIYPYRNNLFIGSQNGMFIYNIDNPATPSYRGEFSHARACDPVVVKDDVAYVTLRGGITCEGFNNQLDVIDVSDLNSPSLLKTYPMDSPHGLAITNDDILYVCDGDSGLRIYKAEEPEDLDQIHHERDLPTYDVIALANDVILVVGRDGLYQYDASNPSELEELSVIPVK